MDLIITLEIENPEEGEKIKTMVQDGLFDLGDGGFWEQECQKRNIEKFTGNFYLRLTSD